MKGLLSRIGHMWGLCDPTSGSGGGGMGRGGGGGRQWPELLYYGHLDLSHSALPWVAVSRPAIEKVAKRGTMAKLTQLESRFSKTSRT